MRCRVCLCALPFPTLTQYPFKYSITQSMCACVCVRECARVCVSVCVSFLSPVQLKLASIQPTPSRVALSRFLSDVEQFLASWLSLIQFPPATPCNTMSGCYLSRLFICSADSLPKAPEADGV